MTHRISYFIKTTVKDFSKLNQIDPNWLAVWAIIYLSFLAIDVFSQDFWLSSALKYLGILLCLIYVRQHTPKDKQLFCAFLFTFLADSILIWTPLKALGVSIFCIAQFFHTYRLSANKYRPRFAAYLASLIIIFIAILLLGVETLYAITAIYAFELLLNTYIAYKKYFTERHTPQTRCAFYGYILFLGCDACVGLSNLALDGLLPQALYQPIAFFVWVFYFPSQILLANSSTKILKINRTEQSNPNKIAK